jgi:hypothetical protein
MAWECGRCNELFDNNEPCPKCGRPLRLTIIGDFKLEARERAKVQVAKQHRREAPTRAWRLLQGLFAVFFILAVYASLHAGAQVAVDELQRRKLPDQALLAREILPWVGAGLAIAIGAAFALRGVFNAQVPGMIAGGLSGFGICAALPWLDRMGTAATTKAPQILMGAGPLEWALLPPAGILVGIGVGFLVRARPRTEETDKEEARVLWEGAWNSTEKAGHREISVRWEALAPRPIIGLVAGIAAAWLARHWVGQAASLRYGSPAAVDAEVARYELAFMVLSGLVAGSFAVAGTGLYWIMGLTMSAVFCFWRVLIDPDLTPERMLVHFPICIGSVLVGAIFGRWAFRPPLVHVNKRGETGSFANGRDLITGPEQLVPR